MKETPMSHYELYDLDFGTTQCSDEQWELEFEIRWRELTEPIKKRKDPLAATIRANGLSRVLAAISQLTR